MFESYTKDILGVSDLRGMIRVTFHVRCHGERINITKETTVIVSLEHCGSIYVTHYKSTFDDDVQLSSDITDVVHCFRGLDLCLFVCVCVFQCEIFFSE